MYHNPQPYYHYAACNHVTGSLQMAPSSMIQHVVRRLQLTPLQVMHLRIIILEFARLSRAASKEGDSLTEQMAQLSLAAVSLAQLSLAAALRQETTRAAPAAQVGRTSQQAQRQLRVQQQEDQHWTAALAPELTQHGLAWQQQQQTPPQQMVLT
jgi:hypothetical protein